MYMGLAPYRPQMSYYDQQYTDALADINNRISLCHIVLPFRFYDILDDV